MNNLLATQHLPLSVPFEHRPAIDVRTFDIEEKHIPARLLEAGDGPGRYANIVLALGAEVLLQDEDELCRFREGVKNGNNIQVGVTIKENFHLRDSDSRPDGHLPEIARQTFPEFTADKHADWTLLVAATGNKVTITSSNSRGTRALVSAERDHPALPYRPTRLWYAETVRQGPYTSLEWGTNFAHGIPYQALVEEDPTFATNAAHRRLRPLQVLRSAADYTTTIFKEQGLVTVGVAVGTSAAVEQLHQ